MKEMHFSIEVAEDGTILRFHAGEDHPQNEKRVYPAGPTGMKNMLERIYNLITWSSVHAGEFCHGGVKIEETSKL